MATRDIENEPCHAREGNHCCHRSPMQHAMMHHRDVYCCWCGLNFCINTYEADAEAEAEYRRRHGPKLQ